MSCPAVIEVATPGPPGQPGPIGPAGIGSAWQQGAGVPGSGVGANGDFYLNINNGDIYGPKAAGSWGSVIFNIAEGQAGPAGPVGPAGPAGAAGVNGRTVLNGSGAPGNGIGANGDFYIDITGWVIYGPKAGGDWPGGASLIGPTGSIGPVGPQGPKGNPGDPAPGTDLNYNPSTRLLSSSTGDDVTLPLATNSVAGLQSSADKQLLADLAARLDAFRDAASFYVSKSGSDNANGTSQGESLLTVAAAVAAANAYATANPGARVKITIGPGEFTESGLPFRLKPNILVQGALQRGTIIKPATGQELLGFFALDSGSMVCDLRFADHQASGTSSTDSTIGARAWAVRLNEAANGGQGVILTASPYVKDCASITAEDDAGLAGSTSTGDTGGGVLVDGAACHPSSPIRSMLVYGFTQQNLGGPGCVVRNDAYAELVSFFGLFGTWHVQCETGGQATLSGGGCSEFGIYGLVADGYSSTPIFTGSLRVSASSGATTVDVVSLSSNRLGTSSRPAAGQIMLLGGAPYVVQSSSPITSAGNVVADSDPTRAGYRVSFYNPSGVGLAGNVAQGAAVDFRQRSQISAGCHSANYVGSGTNYNALPWNGGVPVRGNEAVERNLGRVFGLIVNDVGDVRIAGGAFAVDGTTGAVTINTSQFNLSGLNAIGPFSRNGGVSTVGVQLQEVSNNATLLASTGSSDGNTAPTQFAVRSYADGRFLAALTRTAGQPLTISDTSTQDGNGFWTRSRNIELSLNAANGLAQLDGSGLIPSALLPSYVDDVIEAANLSAFPATGETGKIYVAKDTNKTYRWSGSAYIEISASPGSTDAVSEGSVNLYFTQARARQAISVSGSLSYDNSTGVISYTAPSLATVATTGAYSDLSGRPTLGTAAAANTGTSAGNVVALDGAGKLPAVDGSQLTGLPASGITSIGLSVPTGFSVSGSPLTANGTLTLSYATGYSLPSTASQGNWDTAYTDRLKWDGGSTGLNASTARTSLNLGTAATTDATAYATAAQGALADSAVQPATLSGYVQTSDSRLSDSREWTAATIDQAEAEAGTATTRRAFTAQRVFQAIAAWWAASSAKTKLDGIAAGATVNSSDATLLNRANHTGTQTASTISDFAATARDAISASGSLSYNSSTGVVSYTAPTPFDPASPGVIGGTTAAAGTFTRVTLPSQGSAPSTPASGFSLYANASNALAWKGANGYIRVFDGTTNTADRTYTLPDASGTLMLQGAITTSGLTQAAARILGRSSSGTGAVEELTLPTGFDLSAGALRAPAEIGLACSDEVTALTVGTGKLTFRMPYAMTLTAVRLSVTTAPTGSALVVNIKEGGTTIFSTKPQIDASATTSVGSGTPAVISDSALADNAVITVDIDQIGSTVAGAGLKIWLIGRRA